MKYRIPTIDIVYMIVFLLFFLVVGCASLLPKIKIGLKDLSGVTTYNVLVDCDDDTIDWHSISLTECEGGIKDGVFMCENVKSFECEPGKSVLLTGFDESSFPVIDSYIQYIVERFKELK